MIPVYFFWQQLGTRDCGLRSCIFDANADLLGLQMRLLAMLSENQLFNNPPQNFSARYWPDVFWA